MRRGQIWLYSADPTVGDEIGKTRPAIIVSNNDIGVLRLNIALADYRMARSIRAGSMDGKARTK